MQTLLTDIRNCQNCLPHLPHGCRPILQASPTSRILLIGQAPGRKVFESGIPWDDASGDTLRLWLGVEKEQFYDPSVFAIVPMGFCYPGTGKTGDLPPRPECAPLWHDKILAQMHDIQLIILIGNYAQTQYLAKDRKENLTENVRSWQSFLPTYFPLPHPSPLNFRWQAKNKWFAEEVLPALKNKVSGVL